MAAACTDGPSERATPTTTPPATTTVETLPPVGLFTYPTDPGRVITQIAADGRNPLAVPLLTIYGDGRVITAFEVDWLEGTVSDLTLQEFFDEADEAGLLAEPLELRGPDIDETPDIAVEIAVDGRELRHELDLARIEWPVEPRAFLQRSATRNPFALTAVFEPELWVSCGDDGCVLTEERTSTEDRPVLPHEDPGELISEANEAAT